MRNIMKIAFKSLLLVFFLSGCTTIGKYRILKEEISPKDVAAPLSNFSSQSFRIPEEEITFDFKVVRWNFKYFLDIEIINESKTEALIFDTKKIVLFSANDRTELKLKKIRLLNELSDTYLPDVITLLGKQKIILQYEYEGSSIMSTFHPITTEKQRKIRVEINGLSRKKPVPVAVSFELYNI